MNDNMSRRSFATLRSVCCGFAQRLLVVYLVAFLSLQAAGLTAAAQSPRQQPAPATQNHAGPPASNAEIAAVKTPELASDGLPSAPEPQSAQQSQQQASPQQPVGTAAAPYERPTGVPGSRPAGAVIAPAKQKRVRSIVIRVGLLVAGGAAIGTVVGLSRASHSQP